MEITETKVEGKGYSYIVNMQGYSPMMINSYIKLSNAKVEKCVKSAIENGWI